MNLKIERNLSQVQNKLKGQWHKYLHEKKPKALVVLLSAQTTINGGSSVHVCEEDMGSHWSITDRILFITEPLTHEIWRSGKVKISQSNQACLSRLQFEHHCCARCKGGVWPPWNCSVLFTFAWDKNWALLDISWLLQYLEKLWSVLRLMLCVQAAVKCEEFNIFKIFSFCMKSSVMAHGAYSPAFSLTCYLVIKFSYPCPLIQALCTK